MSSGTTHICSYVSVISMIDMNGWDATNSYIISWFGSGVESSTVLAFHSHALMMVWSFSSHSMDGVLFCAGSLDGLWLIYDNYPSSIPIFYIVWDTLRNLT